MTGQAKGEYGGECYRNQCTQTPAIFLLTRRKKHVCKKHADVANYHHERWGAEETAVKVEPTRG